MRAPGYCDIVLRLQTAAVVDGVGLTISFTRLFFFGRIQLHLLQYFTTATLVALGTANHLTP